MTKLGNYGISLEDAEGIELIPTTTASDVTAVPKNVMTFQIGCRKRNFCRKWQKQEVKRCMYCKHNKFHLVPTDGFPLEDNFDSTVPTISFAP